jgi:hypothetical protein
MLYAASFASTIWLLVLLQDSIAAEALSFIAVTWIIDYLRERLDRPKSEIGTFERRSCFHGVSRAHS